MTGNAPFPPELVFIKKLFTKILRFLTLSIGLLAFVESSTAAELPFGKGVLWHVSKDGQDPSIIFGTIHSSERRVVDFGAEALKLLATSDSLLVDIVDDDSIKQKLFSVMLYQDNRRLDELVSADTFEKIKVLGYEYGYLARQMKVLKPWAARGVFSSPPSEASRISLGIRTISQTLQDFAQNKGTAIIALQTVEEQLASLESANEQEQIALLDTLPSNIGSIEAKYLETLELYLQNDTSGMYQQMLDGYTIISDDFSNRYVSGLVTQPNHRMVQRMQNALAQGNSFVAIDALHLPGEEGILSLLQAQGYTIRPME